MQAKCLKAVWKTGACLLRSQIDIQGFLKESVHGEFGRQLHLNLPPTLAEKLSKTAISITIIIAAIICKLVA